MIDWLIDWYIDWYVDWLIFKDVAHSFQKFLFSLLSFHPFFAKTILRLDSSRES